MDLAAHYNAMRTAALSQLAHGEAELDPLIDSPHDTRRGLTLLTRPPAAITAAITEVLAEFQAVDPAQYYYPAPDIHLTILSIISCYLGFTLAAVDPARYQVAVQTILADCRPFKLTYAGLTASPGGIMVQGFPQDAGLQHLRTATRQFFQNTDLSQSIDRRYVLQTAHSTVIRFRKPLASPARLLATIRRYQPHFFGSFEVNTAELVFNDWYQRAANTQLLHRYSF
jgi:2'-5' RNA ligase